MMLNVKNGNNELPSKRHVKWNIDMLKVKSCNDPSIKCNYCMHMGHKNFECPLINMSSNKII